ncbi:MAG: hypothetical protein M5U28_05800 [Sandaracinaceae bacterium]|nr:hypothetical protein [Sandaracinaceae bacterium]
MLELDTTFEAEDLAIEAPASTGMVLSTGVVARANRVRMRGARSIAVLEQRGSTLELRNVVASGAENGILVTDENDVLLEDALLNEAAPFAERGSRMFCINGARAVMRRWWSTEAAATAPTCSRSTP